MFKKARLESAESYAVALESRPLHILHAVKVERSATDCTHAMRILRADRRLNQRDQAFFAAPMSAGADAVKRGEVPALSVGDERAVAQRAVVWVAQLQHLLAAQPRHEEFEVRGEFGFGDRATRDLCLPERWGWKGVVARTSEGRGQR